MPSIRTLLVDDHALVRAGLRTLLEGIADVVVVAEAGNGEEALRLAAEHRPDLVVTDIAMPQLGGLDAAAKLREMLPDAKVLMLSMHASEEYVRRALRAGASGYLLKDAAAVELELAVRSVMRGETYLSPRISTQVVDQYVRGPGQGSPVDALTPRQREILQLIASGKSTKQIAHDLGLSVKTVETHRAQLMERLGIRDVAGLVRLAIRAGLISSD
jgi:DNA-binding NarL/FixJ family response regulator